MNNNRRQFFKILALIEAIAQQRGYRLKGGAADFEKASLALLQDYRDGALGRISLETPATRVAILAAPGERPTERSLAESPAGSGPDDQ